MTIRYECSECSSVLKIKAEKAGQQGKCPKCKSRFTIPEASQKAEPVLTEDDLIDMPLEITPAVVSSRESNSAGDDFDPLAVLNSDSASGRIGAAAGTNELKPSVSDLMKEHREKRSREEARRSKQQPQKVNPLLGDVETSGSAADAITRSYEKKRGESSDAPRLTREERRAAEERSGMIRFGAQLGAVLLVFGGFAYVLLTYALSGETANVVQVTGVVSFRNQPLTGMRIRFTPDRLPRGKDLAGGPSSAKIDASGNFRLLYNAQLAGAIVGKHTITLEDTFGIPLFVPPEFTHLEVTEDGDNHFELNF
jgi:DNA-directed RNA polymerase subunit RPC12/RpoP